MMLRSKGFYRLLRPLLFRTPPETAHRLALWSLRKGLYPAYDNIGEPALAVRLWSLGFPNPVGLAAGFDKNAEVPDALLGLGFGFVEVGSITPLPQAGNPKPRLYRLSRDRALINRLGFNNSGHKSAILRLGSRTSPAGIVGVNIGANRDSADPVLDYVKGVGTFNAVADYITVNVSSPNTAGLRMLQARHELKRLLDRLALARQKLDSPKPLVLKISPDLSESELEDIADIALGGTVDGIILSNTTVSRPALKSALASELGGLSGAPLFELSTRNLARLYRLTGGRLPLIGVGGVSSVETAWHKLRAGASLIQLYTALVYEGPSIATVICRGLAERLKASGKKSITEITGSGVGDWL
jgi:dihydroorotate dehydrogenase